MKLAVVGTRTFLDYKLLKSELDKYEDIEVIISGGAKGADSLAAEYAEEKNIDTMIFIPEWEKYGKAAGPKRNKKIIEECDKVIAFWDEESYGTLSSIKFAKSMSKELNIVYYLQ